MRTPLLCLFSLLLTTTYPVMAGGSAAAEAKTPSAKHRMTYTSKQDFESVKSAINEAIIEKGLVINNVSHIGSMLQRTSGVVEGAQPIFLKAESYEFCSATVSRLTMEADPHNIVFCPYIISVYVLPKEPNKTYISFRKPDLVGSVGSKAALKEVDKLLRDIIEQALQ